MPSGSKIVNAGETRDIARPGRAKQLAQTPVKFEEKWGSMAPRSSRVVYLFTFKFLLPSGKPCPILVLCSWDVSPVTPDLRRFLPTLAASVSDAASFFLALCYLIYPVFAM